MLPHDFFIWLESWLVSPERRGDNEVVAPLRGVSNVNTFRIAALAAVGMVALIEPVFAGATPAPGPIAGVGVASLAIVGGAYWLGRKFLGHKN
jgi:hypothetical protein